MWITIFELQAPSYLGFFPTGKFAVGTSVIVTTEVSESFKKGKTLVTVLCVQNVIKKL